MQTTQYLEKKVQCALEEYLQREYGHGICILDGAQRVIPILYTHVYDGVSNQFELQISDEQILALESVQVIEEDIFMFCEKLECENQLF